MGSFQHFAKLRTHATTLAFSPDGRSIVVATTDMRLHVWDTGVLPKSNVIISRAGPQAKLASQGPVVVLEDFNALTVNDKLTSKVLWSPRGNTLLEVTQGAAVKLWHMDRAIQHIGGVAQGV